MSRFGSSQAPTGRLASHDDAGRYTLTLTLPTASGSHRTVKQSLTLK